MRPSVRISSGRGSRNLFSRNDLFCFAVIDGLNEIGAPVAAIQKVLEKFSPSVTDDLFCNGQKWVRITRKGRDAPRRGI